MGALERSRRPLKVSYLSNVLILCFLRNHFLEQSKDIEFLYKLFLIYVLALHVT